MSAQLDLAPDERQDLARLLAELGRVSGITYTLGGLLRAWNYFVTQVERGYDDSIYEYTNDLSVRDLLEHIIQGSRPGLRDQLEGVLVKDDQRFKAATQENTRPIGEFAETKPPWWWLRVPRRRPYELAEDLESLGYLDP